MFRTDGIPPPKQPQVNLSFIVRFVLEILKNLDPVVSFQNLLINLSNFSTIKQLTMENFICLIISNPIVQVLLGDHDITTDNETQSLRLGVSSLELHPQYNRSEFIKNT